MAYVAVDFGTSNTVLARHNESTRRLETIEIPGITTPMRYRLPHAGTEQTVHVVPSLIHYSEHETLIGDQVLARGLADHRDTFRWMKRAIADRIKITQTKMTAQGRKTYGEAGNEFLTLLLNYASDQISLPDDAFTFTAPTEAFETFEDWLRDACSGTGIRRLRLLDEPTACVFGYHGAARQDERFVVFDFGGGTLDVSVVRLDMGGGTDKKAIQLGRAGSDLGGADIDQWVAKDFCKRHALDNHARRELEAVILRQAEAVKIQLSDPGEPEAVLNIVNDVGNAPRVHQTRYLHSCPECERGRAGKHPGTGESCLGCILLEYEFLTKVGETLDRALESATAKVQLRRDEITRVLVTGGTSLVPAVRRALEQRFGTNGRIVYDQPFDSVARGACTAIVSPVLQHDYAIESFSVANKRYEFKMLFRGGAEWPTPSGSEVRFWAKGGSDGQTRIGLKIFEVSRMRRRALSVSIVDEEGALRDSSLVESDYEYICLNPDNPTFIIADPPVNKERDKQRILCTFKVDGKRRLLVTVVDNLAGKTLLKDHPVVRL